VLPLVRSQILNGWLWVAAHSARDLTAPLMLMTSGSMVAASVVWIKWDLPDLPGASAVSVLLVAGLLAVVVPIQILTSRGMDE
jgi:iron(III) transport system permease protein